MERYGEYEQVNGGVANDAIDRADTAEQQRDTAWSELREIRAAIAANPEESTADEVRRVVAQRDKLLELAQRVANATGISKSLVDAARTIIAEIEQAK